MTEKNAKLPLISVVIPCFNSVDYIERTIRSVVEQNYPNIELFVKDGGSKDGTLDIIKFYAKKYPKIIRWISNPDDGQTDAINFGFRKVKGEILAYLNADDTYKKGALKIVGRFFIQNPKLMWAYGACDIIDSNDKIIRGWITQYKNFWLKHYSYSTLLILNYISQMACFWRRKAAKAIGTFDKSQYLVMDYDYWLRLGAKFPAGVIPKTIANFRVTTANKSSTNFVQQFEDEFKVAKRHTENPLIVALHYLHYKLVILIYSFLRIQSGINFYRKLTNDYI